MKGHAALATLVAAFAITRAAAQSGSLEVWVTDPSRAPLPGATVTIRHPLGYVKESAATTNREGLAEFPVLRATGTSAVGYDVTVTMPGFAPHRVPDVKLRIAQTTRLAVQLSEEIVERVTVEAKSDVVALEQTAQSTKFDDEFIADLPVFGRFYQNVLTLAPGVLDANEDGNPNVHGARDRDFKAVVSGISNVDPLTGQRMFDVNPNSIEELEILTAGAGVEFRRAQGGFARILQKQGSNDFEGVFEFYGRSDLFDGDGAGDYSEVETPGFASYQPAVQLSGPLVRDRLWYRLSHEFIHLEDPINVTDGIALLTDERTISSDQLTWQVSPRNKLALHYQSDPRTIHNFGVTSRVPAESAAVLHLGGDTYSLTWTAPYSPRILVEAQAAWQDLNIGARPTTPDAVPRCLVGPAFLRHARCEDESGTISGPYPLGLDDHRQRFTTRGDATLHAGRLWGMPHQFKFGLSIENERYFRDLTVRPDLDVFIVTVFDATGSGGSEGPERQALIFGEVPVPERTRVRANGVAWGLYAEDQIKPWSNVAVTLGLALDREAIASNGNGTFFPEAEFRRYNEMVAAGISDEIALQEAFTAYESLSDFYRLLAQRLEVPYDVVFLRQTVTALQSQFWAQSRRADNVDLMNTNLSPFLSLAWDPWSDGKTKLAVTGRRYYGLTYLAIPLLEINPPSAVVGLVASPAYDEAGREYWVVLPGSHGLSRSVSPAVNVDAVSRDLATPYNDEFTLSVEREIATETAIKLTYVRRSFHSQYQDVDANHIPLDLGRCKLATLASRQPIVPMLPGDTGYDPRLAPGDGIVDDCAGKFKWYRGAGAGGFGDTADIHLERSDGLDDLYVQNPGWGNVFLVGNFNEIDYRGVTLELVRRQYRNWELHGNYTWSEAMGDGEDFAQLLGDDKTLIEDERGYQAYDQRHMVNVSATTITPWGFRLGGVLRWQSGLPYSILWRKYAFDQIPPVLGGLGAEGAGRVRTVYPLRVRNSERNPSFWNVDLKVSREMRLGAHVQAQVSAEIFNLLNDGTYIVYSPLSENGQQVNGLNEATRRFGRQWQLGLKLAF